MKSTFRRFFPLILVGLSWLILLCLADTRANLQSDWQANLEAETFDFAEVNTSPFKSLSPDLTRLWLRYPHNKSVAIESVLTNSSNHQVNLLKLAELYRRDPYVLRLQLGQLIGKLDSVLIHRYYTFPAAGVAKPPIQHEEWREAIELAKRGQRMEPQNTYFDWMLIFALLSAEREKEALQAVRIAASKAEYDSHNREAILHSLEFLRLKRGATPTPNEVFEAANKGNVSPYSQLRSVSRWMVNKTLTLRAVGKHREAIDLAMNALVMSETLRKTGNFYHEARIGSSLQGEFLTPRTEQQIIKGPKISRVSALPVWQSHPFSLHNYVRQVGRRELVSRLNKSWLERRKWSQVAKAAQPGDEIDKLMEAAGRSNIVWRLRSLILHTLPWTLLAWAVFSLLARRYSKRVESKPIFRQSGWFSVALIIGMMGIDSISQNFRSDPNPNWFIPYFDQAGLLAYSSFWVYCGVVLALISFAINRAIQWQKRQCDEQKSFIAHLKTFFSPADDGLTRFDFGWPLSWVARLSLWAFLLFTLGFYSSRQGIENELAPWSIALFLTAIAIGLNTLTWVRRPSKVAAMFLALRFVSQTCLAYIMTATFIYFVASLSGTLVAQKVERDFIETIQKSETIAFR